MTECPAPRKPYYYHIDLLRFLFSILIVYFHLLHSFMIPFVTDPFYADLALRNSYSENIVACFFILGGVFLYRSYQANPERSVFDYLVSRVARLWPMLIVSTLFESIVSGNFNWNRVLINAFFLQCSGLSLEYRGILWYVSAFFFASIFLYALLRTLPFRRAMFTISLVSYFSCVFLINYFGGDIRSRETVLYVLNTGVLRGVAFMGIGILLSFVCQSLSDMFESNPLSGRAQILLLIFTIVTEALCLVFLVRYFLCSPTVGNHMVLILVFSLLLACLLSRDDLIGFLLNRKSVGACGKYAYSIYTMQGTGFCLLQKTLWKLEGFTANIPLALICSILIVVLLGIGAYHLVELPCIRLYRRWLRRGRESETAYFR